jgi:maltooligosyltrehalose trehalohydrolase
VHCLENHDQVANASAGQRLHQLTSPGRLRALTALLLLGPATPMLFQGQEFTASAPFLFFADHKPELAGVVRQGRKQFLRQFPSLASAAAQRALPDPIDPQTLQRCRLDWTELPRNAHAFALHRDLIQLSLTDRTLRSCGREHMHGAVLAADCFLLRFLDAAGDDRLLLLNLGRQLTYGPCPEPLLAPPEQRVWCVLWSSEDPCYGGPGTPLIELPDGWHIPAECALLMGARNSRNQEDP